MKTAVVFQGGGVLGAFAAGAWQSLAPRLRSAGADVIAFGGASIGAFNAALAASAQGDDDLSAQALQQWWCEEVATPSFPFVWPAAWAWLGRDPGEAERLNGLLTALLLPSVLQQPAPWHWQLGSGLQRTSMPFYERPRLKRTLERLADAIAAREDPRVLVCVAASELPEGTLRLFDSDAGLRAAHIEASTAIPLLYRPVDIDGRLYWDGELNRTSMLMPLIERLVATGRLARGEPLRLVTVEQVRGARPEMPSSDPELADLALSILLHGKPGDPPPQWDGPFEWLRVCRPLARGDSMSGQFDHSPGRIAELVDAGRQAADRVWRERAVSLQDVNAEARPAA